MTNARLQQDRLIAAAIDVGVAVALSIALWIVGAVLGVIARLIGAGPSMGEYMWHLVVFGVWLAILAYILGRDVLINGQSLGKRLKGIRVVTGAGTISTMDSVKRNVIFAVGPALSLLVAALQLIPFIRRVLACLFSPVLMMIGVVIAVAAVIVEVIKIMQDPYGVRFGDQIANTRVIE